MGLSRTVSDIDGDFSQKSQNFPTLVFCASMKVFPLELGTGAGSQKTRMLGYLAEKDVWTITLAVWIQYINVTRDVRIAFMPSNWLTFQRLCSSRMAL